MLDSLFTSKMRIQILTRFFLNADSRSYLRELAHDFGASPGHVRSELQQLSSAGLLASEKKGRQIQYRANCAHPLYPELHSMMRKALGMDRILDSIVERLGNLEAAYLTGDYAEGKDTGIIDLVLVGNIDRANLIDLVGKTERYLARKIRPLVVSPAEWIELEPVIRKHSTMVLWIRDVAA